MMLLKLTARTPEQEKIKSYLQNNASEVLAEKINNGTPFEKDGKNLINKKTLDGFMQFAREEAKKFITDKEKTGYKVLCIDDDTVYGWAIHYFEEESIEGTLYNEDGTEYSPVKKRDDRSPAPPVPKKQKARPQLSLFDMLPPQKDDSVPPGVSTGDTKDDSEPTEKEIREVTEEKSPAKAPPLPAPTVSPAVPAPKLQASPLYRRYLSVKENYTDCIVFYRLGDFYEIFGDDAKTAAAELALTLTSRDCGFSERIPMTGIPCHAVDAYISKLVTKGYKVAVAESGNGNNRDVTRIVAPNSEQESVDEETGEILSEAEMRQFDGDIEEPDGIPALHDVSEITDDDEFDIKKERETAKAFDKDALIILSDLLGDIFILE